MEPIRLVVGRALPLPRADVDTDQIIPSHWLKRLERTGYGAYGEDEGAPAGSGAGFFANAGADAAMIIANRAIRFMAAPPCGSQAGSTPAVDPAG